MTTFIKTLIMTSALLGLSACGGSSGDQPLPTGATLAMTPANIEWKITSRLDENEACIYNPNLYLDEVVSVQAQDSQGRALGNVEVVFSLALAENTYSGLAPVKLYHDRNNNFVPEESEYVSGEDVDLLQLETDEYDGTIQVLLRINISCAYESRLSAFIPGAQASTVINVIEQQSITTNTTDGEKQSTTPATFLNTDHQ